MVVSLMIETGRGEEGWVPRPDLRVLEWDSKWMVSDLLFDSFVWDILSVFTIIIVHLTNMFKLSFLSFYYYCYKILCIYGCGFRQIWGHNPWGGTIKTTNKMNKTCLAENKSTNLNAIFFSKMKQNSRKLTAKTVFCVIGCSVLHERYLF